MFDITTKSTLTAEISEEKIRELMKDFVFVVQLADASGAFIDPKIERDGAIAIESARKRRTNKTWLKFVHDYFNKLGIPCDIYEFDAKVYIQWLIDSPLVSSDIRVKRLVTEL